MSENSKKYAVIIGGGPAGLTAALQLLHTTDITPIVIEELDIVGGIARTVNHNGNRMDIGGHRFFSKNKDIMKWWTDMLPLQGHPAYDEILLQEHNDYNTDGPNPEITDRVMLIRRRLSRIYYLRRFFNYPVTLSANTILNMGIPRTIKAGFGFLWAKIFKLKEDSLENFYINRFGKPLYNMFFKNYTEKVWGKRPKDLDADWGAQRVNGLSLASILKNMLKRNNSKSINQEGVEKSLIEQFIYPKYGPGQLWEVVASEISRLGGIVLTNSHATKINIENNNVVNIEVNTSDGPKIFNCDYFLSSMPIKDLISSISGISIPENVKTISNELPYRDFITIGILVKDLAITNNSKYKTYKNRPADTWIYIQEPGVKIGRLQIFNNWSPYLVADYKGTLWLGLEYFCNEGDELWNMNEDDFRSLAAKELAQIGIIRNDTQILDSKVIKVKKAYPAYFGSYKQLPQVIDWLNTIPNLYCIGRNGQHRYNNMDHSMMTAIEAVKAIASGSKSKENIWSVNTDQEYHEEK